jgi:hypothetical protein
MASGSHLGAPLSRLVSAGTDGRGTRAALATQHRLATEAGLGAMVVALADGFTAASDPPSDGAAAAW